jgi:hypothetical protein
MIRVTAIALALLVAALPAEAQTDDAMLRDAAKRLEVRQADAWLASTEAQLQLAMAQQEAFAAYAAAIRAQAELKAVHRTAVLFVDTAQLPPAPQALAQEVTRQRERADALGHVQAAAAALYPSLTQQQRTVFDFLAMTATGTGSAGPY